MTRDVRLGLAVIAALLLQLPAWSAVTRDGGALRAGAVAVVVVGLTGSVARRLRAPEPLVQFAEFVTLALGTSGVVFLTTPGTGVGELVADTTRHLATSVAPVDRHPGLTVFLFFFMGLLCLLADTLVVGLRRAGWIVIPLLVLVLVPAVGPKVHAFGSTSLLTLALGVVLVLAVAGHHRLPEGGVAERLGGLLTLAVVTALSVGATAVVAPLVPVPPSVAGADGDPIRMGDPSLDLKRNLTRSANVPALRYTTDRPGGVYLRLTTLPAFDADGWRLVDADVRTGALPRPPGLTQLGQTRRTTVEIQRLESEYLPLPYAPQRVTADGRWGHLPESLTVLSLGVPERGRATAGMRYEVTSVDVRPTAEQLAAAADGARPPEGEVTVEVPRDVPRSIIDLTASVTRGASSPGDRAQAILRYLQGPEFEYSLRPAPGTGYETLERFLLEDKVGYCEQYAASMALMARIAGIPSRVAVGFTPGRQSGDAWQVTMHDMHTWPELYFDQWGWVSFEPTPATGLAASIPSPTPSATPTSTAASTPSAEAPTAAPTASPTTQPAPDPLAGDGPPWWPALLVLLATVAALPAVRRALARRRRLTPGRDPGVAALDAWDEIRALFVDHGHVWPPGSPRYAAAVAETELPDAAREPLHRAALAAEAALFGGPGARPSVDASAADVDAVRAGLEEGTSTTDRLRARWWPRSLWIR